MFVSDQPYPVAPGMTPEEAKSALRSAIRAQRERRTERQRSQAGQALAVMALTIPEVRSADTVALYAARSAEPRTYYLIEALAGRGKRVLLPVLGSGLQRSWAWYTSRDDLTDRAPGRPPEPSGETLEADAVALADVIIAPALAVDSAGRRLGQGGGWYDRVLPLARPETRTFALVFAEEVYDATAAPIPTEPHDKPIDAVITPQRWFVLPDGPTSVPPAP